MTQYGPAEPAADDPVAWYAAAAGSLALAIVTAAGCAEAETPTLGDYLNEVHYDAPLEQVSSIPLGEYRIPIVAGLEDAGDEHVDHVWVQLQFALFAETAPEHQAAVEEAARRYEGDFQDRVLKICRATSIEELEDPRLSAVKARLSDAAKALFGANRIRTLVLNDVKTDVL